MDNGGEAPLPAAAGTASRAAVETFELLGNETRLSILLTLWEADDPFEGDDSLSFSELRDRVGIRQGAQFNYHLDKLVDEFVHKTEDGYALQPAGHKIVRTVIGIAEDPDALGEPTEIDLPCPLCGAQTAITYQDQRLYRVCTECDGYATLEESTPTGALLRTLATPALQRDRDARESFEAVRTQIYHDYGLRTAGICPECSGPVDPAVHVCPDHDPEAVEPCASCGRQWNPAVRFVCGVCKHWNSTSFTEISMRHPAVAGFCWDHGIELGYDATDTTRWLANQRIADREPVDGGRAPITNVDVEEELLARDPVRVRVTVRYGDEELQLTMDEGLAVCETERVTVAGE